VFSPEGREKPGKKTTLRRKWGGRPQKKEKIYAEKISAKAKTRNQVQKTPWSANSKKTPQKKRERETLARKRRNCGK